MHAIYGNHNANCLMHHQHQSQHHPQEYCSRYSYQTKAYSSYNRASFVKAQPSAPYGDQWASANPYRPILSSPHFPSSACLHLRLDFFTSWSKAYTVQSAPLSPKGRSRPRSAQAGRSLHRALMRSTIPPGLPTRHQCSQISKFGVAGLSLALILTVSTRRT